MNRAAASGFQGSGLVQLWRRYILALGLIFILVGLSYLVVQNLLHAASDDARLVNMSGRQRMLSQQIVLYAHLHGARPSAISEERLSDAIDLFEDSHRTLSTRPSLSPALQALYFGSNASGGSDTDLDDMVRGYIQDARTVLDQRRGPQQDQDVSNAMARLEAIGPGTLLTGLDQVVSTLEKEAEQRAARLSQVHDWIFAASTAVLILEALFIFLPAHRSARSTMRRLQAKNAELEQAASEIEIQSLRDPLTGLGNRRYLDANLNRLARQAERTGKALALLHIDLDRFKQINDTLGHAAGDYILVHVSEIMGNLVHPMDVLARVGGDEFVLARLIDDEKGEEEDLQVLARTLISAISRPVTYEHAVCRFGASIGIGIAVMKGAPIDPSRLLVNADIALYRAKENGRGRFVVYNKDMEQEVIRTKRISDEVLTGLERGEFVAHYQPQVDARNFQVIGLETLVRWRHPREGLLSPAEFFPIAKELDVLTRIDRLMLRQAVADREQWKAQGLKVPRLAFNITMSGLTDQDFLNAIAEYSGQEDSIAFELMEAIFFDDCDPDLLEAVQRIRAMGFGIEIDDFGTGHASIISLLTLKPDRLKIDQQLIQPITRSEPRRALVASIIEIGRSMGVEVVAEGVETMAHAKLLGEMGCDILQGYAFAPALDATGAGHYLADRGTMHRAVS